MRIQDHAKVLSGGKQLVSTGSFSKYGIYIAFLIIFIVLAVTHDAFLTATNLLNIMKQASITSVVAIGTTFVLISGGLDLSSGSVAAFAGVSSAFLGLPGGYPVIYAVIAALCIGAVCGLVNGFIVAKGGVHPFITTLGMMISVRGMALIVTNAKPVFGLSEQYTFLGSGMIFGVPVLVIAMFAVLVIACIVLDKTRFGRHIYALGGNESAAFVSGIHVVRIKMAVYTIAGAFSGIAGMLLAGRIKSGTPVMAEGLELDAIAAAVIGGVSTTGGIGKVYGAVIGALLLAMVSNGLDLLNVSPYLQQLIKGAIIILAVFFDIRTKAGRK